MHNQSIHTTPLPTGEGQGGGALCLVFATNNKHKLDEIRSILGNRFEVLSLSDINCHADIPETANTLEGNAIQKARYVVENYGYDCFADDTGLLEASRVYILPAMPKAPTTTRRLICRSCSAVSTVRPTAVRSSAQ